MARDFVICTGDPQRSPEQCAHDQMHRRKGINGPNYLCVDELARFSDEACSNPEIVKTAPRNLAARR
jgi:hypothetical protein